MWGTTLRDKLLRPVGFLSGYEAVSWFGSKLVPPSHFYTTFLIATAVGVLLFGFYFLLVLANRLPVAVGPAGAAANRSGTPLPGNAGPGVKTALFPTLDIPSIPERSVFLVMHPGLDQTKDDHVASLFRGLKLPSPFSIRPGSASQQWVNLWHASRGDSKAEAPIGDIIEIFSPLEGLAACGAMVHRVLEPSGLRRALNVLWSGLVPRQPKLSGVMIVLPIERLLRQGWNDTAESLAGEMRALGLLFEAQFPVYVLLSQLESDPYFKNYTKNLRAEERQQTLGATFALASPADREHIKPQLDEIFRRLAGQRLILLDRESSAESKPAIYEYPREWLKVTPRVAAFLEKAIGDLQRELFKPVLRGLHLTGSVKTESRRSPEMTRAFSDVEKVEPLFVAEFVTRVLLNDQFRAYAPANPSTVNPWRAGFAAAAILFFLCLAFPLNSWWGNRRLVDHAREIFADNVKPISVRRPADVSELENLDHLRSFVEDLAMGQYRPTFVTRWGLYQGAGIIPIARDLYFDRFKMLLLDPIRNKLTSELTALSSTRPLQSYDTVRDEIRLYQMIHGRKCSVDASFVRQKLFELRAEAGETDPQADSMTARHFAYYANELMTRDPYGFQSQPLVTENARRYLQEIRGADQLYAGIIQETNQRRSGAQLFDLLQSPTERSKLGEAYQKVLSGPKEVEAAFTRGGIAIIEERIRLWNSAGADDACVVSPVATSTAQQTQISDAMRTKYVEDYQKRWKKFLVDTKLLDFNSASDASVRLNVLTDNQSPLLAVFAFVADNTELGPISPTGTPDSSGHTDTAPSTPSAVIAARTGQVFRPVHRVVPAGSQKSWKNESNDSYIQALRNLGDAMRDLGEKPSDQTAVDNARRAADAANRVVDQIKDGFGNNTDGVDGEVERLLRKPVLECRRFIRTPDPAEGVNQSLRAFCKEWTGLRKKFPFNRQSADEVSMNDFIRVFQPQSGTLWNFAKQGLVARTPGGKWAKGSAAGDLKVDEGFLDFLYWMSLISDAFFQNPNAQFGRKITIQINAVRDLNTSLKLGGAAGTTQFSWPGSSPDDGFLLIANSAPFKYPGLWGIYRMIENADERDENRNRVILSKVRAIGGVPVPLEVNGQPAKVEIFLPDLPGGIRGSLFSGLACPTQAARK